MRKFRIRNLILLTFVLSIHNYSLDVFANTTSRVSKLIPTIETCSTSDSNISSNGNDTTVLDGEIGEWDPELTDKPNFDEKVVEMNGDHPDKNDYYTISVTVPIDMQFCVLPNSNKILGSFFSPTYKIKNNGSKNIAVGISTFYRVNQQVDSDAAELYVAPLKYKNNKTEIELKVCGVDRLEAPNTIGKEIELTKLDTLKEEDKYLYVLSANETKGVKFGSDRWELPETDTGKEKAKSNFRVRFLFSIVR